MMEQYERISPFDESSWTPEQKEFARSVDMAMWGRGRLELRDDSVFNAVYLIHQFFVCAQKEMRIFSGELRCRTPENHPYANMKIYADEHVIDAASAFLYDEGTSLKIVVESVPIGGIESHPLVQRLASLSKANELRGSCEIVKLDMRLVRDSAAAGAAGHEVNGRAFPPFMIIMDQAAYRLETNKEKAEAVVNFNDRDTTKKLIGVFNSLWHGSEPLWRMPAAK